MNPDQLIPLKGRTIVEVIPVQFLGYSGIVSSLQIFLDDGVCYQIKASTEKLDQYDPGTPCLEISEHRMP